MNKGLGLIPIKIIIYEKNFIKIFKKMKNFRFEGTTNIIFIYIELICIKPKPNRLFF